MNQLTRRNNNGDIIISNMVQGTTDRQTLILAYDDPSLLGSLESVVASYKRRTSQSFLDRFRQVDIFVDISSLRTPEQDGKSPWLRIVYECLEGNDRPFRRHPGATVVYVSRVNEHDQLDSRCVPLYRLIEGR